MDEVPSLGELRHMLPPNVLAWVEAVLAGTTTEAWAAGRGISAKHAKQPGYFAEAAGLGETGSNGIREAVLRARIRELEGR